MNIKHIFFDLDHTLWDFETNSKHTFEHIFKTNQIDLSFNDFTNIYKPINIKYWKMFREEKIEKEDLRYARLRESFDALNFQISDELIHILSEQYIEHLSEYNALFNGAIEILNYLHPKYQMHIITNGFHEVQNRKMKNSKILPYFEHIISSEMVGYKKPNPKIFHYALNLANAKPEESIMIGDNLEADIIGAKEVGMHTIFCNFEDDVVPNEGLYINNLSHLKNHL